VGIQSYSAEVEIELQRQHSSLLLPSIPCLSMSHVLRMLPSSRMLRHNWPLGVAPYVRWSFVMISLDVRSSRDIELGWDFKG
jgi:hypothetical protein